MINLPPSLYMLFDGSEKLFQLGPKDRSLFNVNLQVETMALLVVRVHRYRFEGMGKVAALL